MKLTWIISMVVSLVCISTAYSSDNNSTILDNSSDTILIAFGSCDAELLSKLVFSQLNQAAT